MITPEEVLAELLRIKLDFEQDAYRRGFDPTATHLHRLICLLVRVQGGAA